MQISLAQKAHLRGLTNPNAVHASLHPFALPLSTAAPPRRRPSPSPSPPYPLHPPLTDVDAAGRLRRSVDAPHEDRRGGCPARGANKEKGGSRAASLLIVLSRRPRRRPRRRRPAALLARADECEGNRQIVVLWRRISTINSSSSLSSQILRDTPTSEGSRATGAVPLEKNFNHQFKREHKQVNNCFYPTYAFA